MLSVIIATLNSDRLLVPTLAALVPGATDGLISEVLIADGGSADDTATVADVAGCKFMIGDAPLARRLKDAANIARAPFLLFVRPGCILDAPWVGEVRRFLDQRGGGGGGRAAVFRRDTGAQPAHRKISSWLRSKLGGLPQPEQGLLIARRFYDALGGHSERANDPERELIARIGRHRIVGLTTSAFQQILD
jgi:glycosyltransferase involved in cell wall biosynthesis